MTNAVATPLNGAKALPTAVEAAQAAAELVDLAARAEAEPANTELRLLLRQRLTAWSVQLSDLARAPVPTGSRNHLEPPLVPGSPAFRREPVPEPVPVPRKIGNHLPFERLSVFMARAEKLPDPQWLIDRLVPESGRLLVAATANAGKTFLALVIAKTAADKRPVYLVLEEGATKATAKRFQALGFAGDPDIRILHQHGFSLERDVVTLATLLKAGLEEPAPIVVLDPLASIFSGSQNEEMGDAVRMLDVLMRADPRLLLVLSHHTSKAGERGEMGTAMHNSRGGTELPAWADVQLNLKHVSTPPGSGRVEFDALMAKNREGERDYTIRMAIDLGRGDVTMKMQGEAEADARELKQREKILAFVAKAKASLSKNKISDEVGGKKQRNNDIIDELTGQGLLVNDGTGWTVPKAGKST